MGRRKAKGRDISGVFLLDKPTGITSNAALQKVKYLYKANKAGHTGSLDPIASGLLPICIGEATKFSHYLLDADKRYQVEARLGVKTTTGDIEGEVVETADIPEFDQDGLKSVLSGFLGKQEQIPPMHSAIKQNGQPLYKLARQGISVERKSREIVIYELNLLATSENSITLDVKCSKGTYIRTLVEDIAHALGTCAHVTLLRRTQVGDFDIENSVTLERLEETLAGSGLTGIDEMLLPSETAIADWPGVNLSEDAAYYLRQGQAVLVPKAPTQGLVRLYEGDDNFLGVGCILDDGRVAPKRLIKVA
ncbi:MAG: tRNA pseudouridine(55) synthase TruB [Gammaproteobacteria bacterium]|nr:tRNA pseudouridine(55) synthase TruB [Gammaproteobacteria bacterium]